MAANVSHRVCAGAHVCGDIFLYVGAERISVFPVLMAKAYLKYYFYSLCGFSMLLLTPIAYLYLAGEFMSDAEVVERQLSGANCIYGSAVHKMGFNYKAHLVESARPEVVIMGSSRVMQIRGSFFEAVAVNAGGAMRSVNEGARLVAKLVDSGPALVLIGVDIWWFNERYQSPSTDTEPEPGMRMPKLSDAVSVYEWLYEGKIPASGMLNTVLSGACDIGVAGHQKTGFGPDGSYYYTNIIAGARESDDVRFQDTLSRIEQGNRRFQYARSASDQHVENFVAILERLRQAGMHTIVYFPPFASTVNRRMNELGENYAYIDDLKRKLRRRGVSFYDYTDASVVGSGDCEFIDGFHGGEVTNARILSDIALRDSVLAAYVRQEYLQTVIEKNTGMAFVPDPQITAVSEIDFLELGCRK
jgi:hypothetical protein